MLATEERFYQPALHPELEAPPARVWRDEEDRELTEHRTYARNNISKFIDWINAEKIALASDADSLQNQREAAPNKKVLDALSKEHSALYNEHIQLISSIRDGIFQASLDAGGFIVAHTAEVDGEVHQVYSLIPYCHYDIQTQSLVGQIPENRNVVYFSPDQIVL